MQAVESMNGGVVVVGWQHGLGDDRGDVDVGGQGLVVGHVDLLVLELVVQGDRAVDDGGGLVDHGNVGVDGVGDVADVGLLDRGRLGDDVDVLGVAVGDDVRRVDVAEPVVDDVAGEAARGGDGHCHYGGEDCLAEVELLVVVDLVWKIWTVVGEWARRYRRSRLFWITRLHCAKLY